MLYKKSLYSRMHFNRVAGCFKKNFKFSPYFDFENIAKSM